MSKSKIILMILNLIILSTYSQENDSIKLKSLNDKINYKNFIIPSALISSGFILENTKLNENIQKDANAFFGSNFKTKIDNYTQLVPIAQIYGGRLLGLKPKNDLLHQSINIIVAGITMCAITKTLKHTVKEERPDKSNQFSFPSGHTATAFTNASLLYYEYKDEDIWYASSGFVFATATGILRIANNKHYTADVLTGTGIGMSIGLAISYIKPFNSIKFNKKKTYTLVYPQIGKNYGVGVIIIQ